MKRKKLNLSTNFGSLKSFYISKSTSFVLPQTLSWATKTLNSVRFLTWENSFVRVHRVLRVKKTQRKWNMIKPKCSSKASCKAFQVRNFRLTMAGAQQNIDIFAAILCAWGQVLVPQAPWMSRSWRWCHSSRCHRRSKRYKTSTFTLLVWRYMPMIEYDGPLGPRWHPPTNSQRDISGEWLSKSPGADVSSRKPRRIHPCSENQCFFSTQIVTVCKPNQMPPAMSVREKMPGKMQKQMSQMVVVKILAQRNWECGFMKRKFSAFWRWLVGHPLIILW